MNLVGQFLIFTLYYSIGFDYYVVCRISDKRRCVDADCSVPISLATTLLMYNADDKRLLSFPRNVKATIYSKEAGDNPSLWGAEADIPTKTCVINNYWGSLQDFYDICPAVINGKRGYVPKDLLREKKLLVKNSDVKVIVSTGRDDKPKKNFTQDVINSSPRPDSLHTPELTGANSKGFFSTIGVVSADSVPPNSPDIDPQSAKQYEVIAGTTVYHDPGNENVNAFPGAPSEVEKTTPITTSVPASKDSKDVEQILAKKSSEPAEADVASEQTARMENHQSIVKSDSVIKSPDVSVKEVINAKSAGSASESGLIGDFIKGVSDLISSGSGANENEVGQEEDDDDEGTEDDENDDDEEGDEDDHNTELKNSAEGQNEASVSNTVEELADVDQSQNEQENISKAPTLQTVLNQNLTPESTIKNNELNQNLVQSDPLTHDGKGTTEEFTDTVNKNQAQSESDDLSTLVTDHTQGKDADKQETPISTESNISKSFKPDLEKEKDHVVQQSTVETSNFNVFNEAVTGNQIEKQHETGSEEIKYLEANKEGSIAELITDETVNISSETQTQSETESPIKTFVGIVSKESEVKPPNEQSERLLHPRTVEKEMPVEKESYKESEKSLLEPEQHDKPVDAETQPEMQQVQETSRQESLPRPTATALPSFYGFVPSNTSQDAEISNNVAEVKLKSDVSQEIIKGSSKEEPADKVANILVQEVPLPGSPEEVFTTVEELSVTTEMVPSMSHDILSKTQEEVTPDFDNPLVTSTTIEKEFPTESVHYEPTEIPASVEEEVTTEPVAPTVSFSNESSEILSLVEEEVTSESDVPTESLRDQPSEIPVAVEEDVTTESVPDQSSEGMFSWLEPVFDLFKTHDSSDVETEVSLDKETYTTVDSLDPSHTTDETCLADGVGEEACESVMDVPPVKDLTWKESLYYADVLHTLQLLEKIPMETTIWLIVTAVAVLLFSLGHYYIEAHRRDGPLVAVINKLEREVLILKKEGSILEDRLNTAQQHLEAWNINSSENDALIVELKQELEETKVAKAELEDQLAILEREVEAVTESGLEMHRLLSESLSSQDGSQVLLSTVETLKEKLEHQEEEIVGLSESLSHKNMEVEELQEKLVRAADVASSLEDRIVAITRNKEEEALQLKDKHRQLIAQLEEVMETKALDETRVSTEMSKLRLTIEELQKTLAEKDSELDVLKEVVKQLRSTDSNDKMDALFDVVGIRAKLQTAVTERDEYREKFLEEEGARKLLEGHMKKITQEVAELKNSFETAEKDKIEALTKLQVLSNYFKEKESQLQKELGLQESMWLQKQSDDHTIYEQMRSLREENEKYKLQNESLKKEIVEQESSFKIQLANAEQKSHENWVTSRQAERRLKEVQQEAAQLRNRLTMEKNAANYSLDDGKQNLSESNGDPSSPPPSLMFPPTTSPPFMMYPPPGDFVPPPPLMGSPYPSDSRPPPLGRISSPPLDHRFSPPPPLPYPPYDYPPYGHHSPSPPLPMPPHHRNVHKPQPREMSREQKDHVMSNYSPEADKTIRRNKR